MMKISVLIATYNQQDLIGRAIDSILSQKDFGLHKIYVSDDCSKDANWNIISKYQANYPDIVIAKRNATNLGCYGNFNSLLKSGVESDLYYIMAGDDEICQGWFRHVQEHVNSSNIQIDGKAVALYYDYAAIGPNGRKTIFRNNMIKHKASPLGLALRNQISIRSLLFSKEVYKKLKPADINHGIIRGEMLYDRQLQVIPKYNYYSRYVGSIYYYGIGISTKMGNKDILKEKIEIWKDIPYIFKLNFQDNQYAKFRMQSNLNILQPSFCGLMKSVYYFFSSRGIYYKLITKQELSYLWLSVKFLIFK